MSSCSLGLPCPCCFVAQVLFYAWLSKSCGLCFTGHGFVGHHLFPKTTSTRPLDVTKHAVSDMITCGTAVLNHTDRHCLRLQQSPTGYLLSLLCNTRSLTSPRHKSASWRCGRTCVLVEIWSSLLNSPATAALMRRLQPSAEVLLP